MDHRTVAMFGNTVTWYVPLGLKRWFMRQGIQPDKVIELDWWQAHQFNQQVEVTFTPTVHWSKRTLWDANKSLWGSWNVKINDFNSWFAGDTGYDDKVFKEIGRRMGVHQLAFIPIGAYAPRYFMGKHHVDPAQAVLIHQDIQSEKSMPIHWGTFQLTQEPFLEPQILLELEAKLANLSDTEFKIVKIGETISPNMQLTPRLSAHTENKK
jgi:N-acyl-phosphatidylethanolamine-hydrolysing phospholipase D